MANRAMVLAGLLLLTPAFLAAQQHYAVLINGYRPDTPPTKLPESTCGLLGPSANNALWNDTFLMWKTLQELGFPRDHIITLFSNGDDYWSPNSFYQVALGEHVADGPASYSVVDSVFQMLANSMTNEDLLFVWTAGHGALLGAHVGLYLSSGLELMYDTTFARLVNQIPCGQKVVLMAQCYSGGFVDDLEDPTTMVLTACDAEEMSSEADNISPDGGSEGHDLRENEIVDNQTYYHSEFNYHVLNALLGRTVYVANPVPSDADANGEVSIDEIMAWEFATDTRQGEYCHPQYSDEGAIGSTTYLRPLMNLATKNRSTIITATRANNQRKLVRDSSGKLHEVFESGGEVFYRNSTDGGSTWPVISRLSDATARSTAPCIASPGSSVLVTWQVLVGSSFYIRLARSSNGGNNWTSATGLSTLSCASPGPLPSISGASTNATFVAYASSDGILCRKSTDAGATWASQMTLPGSASTFNSPSTGIYRYSTWHYVSQAQIAYATDTVGGSPYIYHNYYDFDAGAFGASPTNVCSIIPNYTLLHHANPSLAVSADDGCLTVHVAWDALDPDYPPAGRVILYRKKPAGYGSFENQYTVIRYQGLERPSITGLSSDNAYMVYQNFGGSSSLWKAKYSLTGGSWTWGYPSWVGTGSNPQISSGSTSSKYLWTSGTTSPYQINVSNEMLSKASGEVDWAYRRALNLIDTKSGAFLSLELGGMRVRKQDGQTYDIGLQSTPSDTTQISLSNLVNFGTSDAVQGLAAADTIELIYACHGRDVEQILKADSGYAMLNVTVGEAGTIVSTILKNQLSDLASSRQAVRMLLPVQGLLPRELTSGIIRLAPLVSGVRQDRSLIASVGHIYEAAGNSSLAKELIGGTQSTTVPSTAELLSNYPNPFNPSTTIRYSLPQKSAVQLVVYNTLGEQVVILFEGEQEQGYHEVRFDGTDLPSGVYFYRLKAGNFSQTKKLLLLR